MKTNDGNDIEKSDLELYESLTPEPALANDLNVVKRLKQDWVISGLRYSQLKKILFEIAGEKITAGSYGVIFTLAESLYLGGGSAITSRRC